MLHLIFQSPVETATLARMDSGDIAVFLGNAVLRILQQGSLADRLTQQLHRNRLCVLADDLKVRGIATNELVEGIEVIGYTELVELTVSHPVIQSWC